MSLLSSNHGFLMFLEFRTLIKIHLFSSDVVRVVSAFESSLLNSMKFINILVMINVHLYIASVQLTFIIIRFRDDFSSCLVLKLLDRSKTGMLLVSEVSLWVLRHCTGGSKFRVL